VLPIALAILLGAGLGGCLAERVDEEPGLTGGGASCSDLDFSGFTGTRTPNATWTYLQAKIFSGRGSCTTCHTGSGAGPSDLSLDADQYDRIVTNHLMSGYTSANLEIVEPGFKSCSFLYLKVSESDSALVSAKLGSRMPLNHQPLGADDIDLIGAWIDEGAVKE
jgi:hypothetical protein